MSTQRMVIGIVGMPASGKGTIAAYLERAKGARKLRFSDTLHTVLAHIGMEESRDNMIKLSEAMRECCGEDILARAVMVGVERSDAPFVVIDGLRRNGDLELFRTMPGFHLIAVDADPRVRYERAKLRAEKPEEATQTFEDFMALENRSTEVTCRELMTRAEMTIDNNGTLEELYARVDAFLNSSLVRR